jgi:hypothetical protein
MHVKREHAVPTVIIALLLLAIIAIVYDKPQEPTPGLYPLTDHNRGYIGTECLYPIGTPNSLAQTETPINISPQESYNFLNEKMFFPSCSVWVSGVLNKASLMRLKEETIVIMGDSMMRQIFHAIVSNLRMIERVYDYYYHSNAVYVLNLITGNDRLIVAIQSHEEIVRYLSTFSDQESSIVVVFIWNPTLERKFDLELFSRGGVGLSIYIGLHYHKTQKSVPVLSLVPSLSTPNTTVTWVLMTCYPRELTDSSDPEMMFRNKRQMALQSELVPLMKTIDPCEISRNIPRIWDNTHFQCGLVPQITNRDNVLAPDGLKVPVNNGTCVDILNKWITDRIMKTKS